MTFGAPCPRCGLYPHVHGCTAERCGKAVEAAEPLPLGESGKAVMHAPLCFGAPAKSDLDTFRAMLERAGITGTVDGDYIYLEADSYGGVTIAFNGTGSLKAISVHRSESPSLPGPETK